MADLFLCSKKCGKLEGAEAAPKSRIPLGCTCSQVPSVANAPNCKHSTVEPLCSPLRDPGWCYWLSGTSGWINFPAAANSTEKTGWFSCTCCRIESPGISPVSVWWQSSQTGPWQYCWLWAVEPVSISIVHCWILCYVGFCLSICDFWLKNMLLQRIELRPPLWSWFMDKICMLWSLRWYIMVSWCSYEMLALDEQLEIARQIGTTRTHVLTNLRDLALSTSFL